MSEEQALYIADRVRALKAIADARLPEEHRLIEACASKLDGVIDEYGELGLIALEMVVALKRIEFGNTETGRALWPQP